MTKFNGINILHPSFVSLKQGSITLESGIFQFLGKNYPFNFMELSLMGINISDKVYLLHNNRLNLNGERIKK